MKLTQTSTFKRTVKVTLPTDKTDVYRTESLVARYNLLDDDEQKSLEGLNVREQLDKVLTAVEGVGDDEGNAYPPDEALSLCKRHPIVSLALLHAYNEAVTKDILGKTQKPSSGK